jgi:hypothetical protein
MLGVVSSEPQTEPGSGLAGAREITCRVEKEANRRLVAILCQVFGTGLLVGAVFDVVWPWSHGAIGNEAVAYWGFLAILVAWAAFCFWVSTAGWAALPPTELRLSSAGLRVTFPGGKTRSFAWDAPHFRFTLMDVLSTWKGDQWGTRSHRYWLTLPGVARFPIPPEPAVALIAQAGSRRLVVSTKIVAHGAYTTSTIHRVRAVG